MSEEPSKSGFTNMDALYLEALSASIEDNPALQAELSADSRNPNEVQARLLSIARNLQRMDDRQSTLYAKAFREGEDAHLGRSNVYKGSNPISPDLASALANFRGEVTRIDPVQKKSMDNTLTVEDLELDLTFEDEP